MVTRQSLIENIRDAYLKRFKVVLLSSSIFLVSGSVLLILFFREPTSPLSQMYLNIGSALLTGMVFSLVVPIFLAESEDNRASLAFSHQYDLIANRFMGLGRVWPNEDLFNKDFDIRQCFREHSEGVYVFVGLSLTRVFETYGHIIESTYSMMPRNRWRPCLFFIADPNSEYVKAHINSPYGRKDTVNDIEKTIQRYQQIRAAIARSAGCTINDVPLRLYLTETQIRFGIICFRKSFSALTLYRFGSRSYFNPRFEILYSVIETNQVSPLGQWIENYIDMLEANSKEMASSQSSGATGGAGGGITPSKPPLTPNP